MNIWKPKSWSAQARELGDRIFQNVIAKDEFQWSIERARNFFGDSYRAPIIRRRAAKRFKRLVRKARNRGYIFKEKGIN